MLTTNSTGTDLHYEAVGSGPPVVLCAGAAAASGFFTDTGFDVLMAKHFRVVLIDYTGMGRSARVDHVSPTQWCEDVISVLDAENIDRAHIAGVSLGARVAARVALDRPDRILTLTVDNPITHVDPLSNARLTGLFENPDASPLTEGWARMHGTDWRDVIRFYARARDDAALQDHLTLRPHLRQIAAPTLITRGDRDDEIHPLTQAFEWHGAAQRSWLWIAPGTTAGSTVLQVPEKFVEVYREFVAAAAS